MVHVTGIASPCPASWVGRSHIAKLTAEPEILPDAHEILLNDYLAVTVMPTLCLLLVSL